MILLILIIVTLLYSIIKLIQKVSVTNIIIGCSVVTLLFSSSFLFANPVKKRVYDCKLIGIQKIINHKFKQKQIVTRTITITTTNYTVKVK